MEFLNGMVNVLKGFGLFGLIVVAFAESSFFPIPPDVILIPLSIDLPKLALFYALVTTLSSVAGAVLGWGIGKKFGRKILFKFVSTKTIAKADHYFERYGGQTMAIAGFTPIPYKVFTILSGAGKLGLRDLIVWSLVGRGGRFFLEAAVIMMLGQAAEGFISKYFSLITIGVVALVAVIYGIYKVLNRRK